MRECGCINGSLSIMKKKSRAQKELNNGDRLCQTKTLLSPLVLGEDEGLEDLAALEPRIL
jgi:hypothetical protein